MKTAILFLLVAAGTGFGGMIIETGAETPPQVLTPILQSINTSPTPNGVWSRSTAWDEGSGSGTSNVPIELDILPPPGDIRASALTDIQIHFNSGTFAANGAYWFIRDNNKNAIVAHGSLGGGVTHQSFNTPIVFESGPNKPTLELGSYTEPEPWVLRTGWLISWRITMQGRFLYGN